MVLLKGAYPRVPARRIAKNAGKVDESISIAVPDTQLDEGIVQRYDHGTTAVLLGGRMSDESSLLPAVMHLTTRLAATSERYGRTASSAGLQKALLEATSRLYGPAAAVMVDNHLKPGLARANELSTSALSFHLASLERAARRSKRKDALTELVQARLADKATFRNNLELSLQNQMIHLGFDLSIQQVSTIAKIIAEQRQFVLQRAQKQLELYRTITSDYLDTVRSIIELRSKFESDYLHAMQAWVRDVYDSSGPIFQLVYALDAFFRQSNLPITRSDLLPSPNDVLDVGLLTGGSIVSAVQ